MSSDFICTMGNFIKGLKIIEKYTVTDSYPIFVDSFQISFNTDAELMKQMTKEDREELERLRFHVRIEENTIFTDEYTY